MLLTILAAGTAIPGRGNNIVLTADDGAYADVIGAYIQFDMFTGVYVGWAARKTALRPSSRADRKRPLHGHARTAYSPLAPITDLFGPADSAGKR